MTHTTPPQPAPMLRAALMLILGMALGDALAACVPSAAWMILTVLLLSVLVVLHVKNGNAQLQSGLLLVAITLSGAWRMGSNTQSLRVSYSPHEETFRAVVSAVPVQPGPLSDTSPSMSSDTSSVTSPLPSPRPLRYEIIIADGRLAGHKAYAYIQPICPDTASQSICPDTVSLSISPATSPRAMSVGDGLSIRARLLPPVSPRHNPSADAVGHFSYQRWLQVHGIVARCYVSPHAWRPEQVSLRRLSGVQRLSVFLGVMRHRLLTRLHSTRLSSDALSVLSAMTLGDKRLLSHHQRDYYSASGASHLLALSGMHLSVVFVLLQLLLARGRRHGFMQSLVLIAVWTYVLMVGMPSSVVRSAVMCTVFSLEAMTGRRHMPLNTLGMAAVLLLVCSPQSLFDIGFQLSFMAVLGIFLFNHRVSLLVSSARLLRHRVFMFFWSLLTVSLSAQLLVFPLVLYYFGRFSCYFLLANLIAIPLATAIVYTAILMFLLLPVPHVSSLAVALVDSEVRLLNFLLQLIASLPGSTIDNISLNLPQLFLIYFLVFGIYLIWKNR